jgi:hypothetical protein
MERDGILRALFIILSEKNVAILYCPWYAKPWFEIK